MEATQLAIPDVLLIHPQVFADSRGLFYESFNQRNFEALIGRTVSFVQDNHSFSKKDVLRGLHYQIQHPQGKLVRVVQGAVFDVAVDIRKGSSFFGRWVGEIISAENKRQLWIPEGFAHGFLVISESAEFLYKTTDYYSPDYERTLRWDDSELAIGWPTGGADPICSEKDSQGKTLSDADLFA